MTLPGTLPPNPRVEVEPELGLDEVEEERLKFCDVAFMLMRLAPGLGVRVVPEEMESESASA